MERLIKQLKTTELSAFLSLIQFEKDWNPHGTNDNHRYEDLFNEISKAHEATVRKKKQEVFLLKHERFYGECVTKAREDEGYPGKMSVVPKSSEGTITFKMDKGSQCGQSKTGPIYCQNGFTVEVELVKGCYEEDDW